MAINADNTITPAERRRQRVRTAILDAAEKVFAEEGEEGLSIRRLADEIDYSPAAIYRYFGSKEELVDELKEVFFERILVLIGQSRESAEIFPVRMRKCIAAYIGTALEKPHHYAAAFTGLAQTEAAPLEFRSVDGPVRRLASGTSNKTRAFDFLVEMMETGQREGHLRRDLDPAAAAFCTWSACHGLAMIIIHTQALPALMSSDGSGGNDLADSPCAAQAAIDTMIDSHADIIARGLEIDPGRVPDRPLATGQPPGPKPEPTTGPTPGPTPGPTTCPKEAPTSDPTSGSITGHSRS